MFWFAVLTGTGLVCAFVGFVIQMWTTGISLADAIEIQKRSMNAGLFQMLGWFLFIAGVTMITWTITR